MILGLTGLIGSGKSEVAGVFEKMGAKIIDADVIGRELVERESTVFYRLIREFGSSILTRQGKLNRRKLGRLAFSSPQKTELLNAIVHPALLKSLDRQLSIARASGVHTVVDAALLIFWNYHKKMDSTILVSSFKAIRYERLLQHGFTLKEIRQRSRSQLPLAVLRSKANHVITNNKDLCSLHSKARKLYLGLTEIC